MAAHSEELSHDLNDQLLYPWQLHWSFEVAQVCEDYWSCQNRHSHLLADCLCALHHPAGTCSNHDAVRHDY